MPGQAKDTQFKIGMVLFVIALAFIPWMCVNKRLDLASAVVVLVIAVLAFLAGILVTRPE